jgi:ribosomal protein S8
MNDPLGDMLTRIRNAQMRGKSKVISPASKLRCWVLDVLQAEGYIRGYSESKTDNGGGELEIELKYSGNSTRVQTGPPCLFLSENHAGCPQRIGHFHHLNAQRRDVG